MIDLRKTGEAYVDSLEVWLITLFLYIDNEGRLDSLEKVADIKPRALRRRTNPNTHWVQNTLVKEKLTILFTNKARANPIIWDIFQDLKGFVNYRALVDGMPKTPRSCIETFRNAIKHNNDISEIEIHLAIAFSHNLISAIKKKIISLNMDDNEYDVARIIKIEDLSDGRSINGTSGFLPMLTKHVGDQIHIKITVDPTYSDYDIHWRAHNSGSSMMRNLPGNSTELRHTLTASDINPALRIVFRVFMTDRDHHLHGSHDHERSITYQVKPVR